MTDQELNQIIAALAKWGAVILAAGGGGAVIAYRLFTHLGKTWLDEHFKKKLENTPTIRRSSFSSTKLIRSSAE